MAMTKTEAAGAQEWTARPNCSLTPTVRRNLVCGILAISLLVSGGFLLAGAWLVLPFAGLELAALYIALRALDRADSASETIRLEGDRLTVTTRFLGRDNQQSFSTAWARVSLEAGDAPDPLICIRSHGRSCQVGRLMTPPQRHQFFSDLSRRLRSQTVKPN